MPAVAVQTNAEQRRDLLKIMDHCHGKGSTTADAIPDRLVHNVHRLVLNGVTAKTGCQGDHA